MQVFVQKIGKTVEVEHAGSALSLLERLGINPEVVLIVRDGELITPDERVDGAARIELLSVVSGG
jgi:sulfur carrier protein ThiS